MALQKQKLSNELMKANITEFYELVVRPRKIQRVESGEDSGAGTVSKVLHSRPARSYKKAELLVPR